MNDARRIAAVGLAALVVACGGGAVAVLGFIGPAGGDFNVDGNAALGGLQPQFNCGVDPCALNVQVASTNNPATGTPWERLYDSAFDVEWTSNLTAPPACVLTGNATGTGRVDGNKVTLGSCFVGQSVSVIEMVSNDGALRLFFNFVPNFTDGVWVDIHDGGRRFKFGAADTVCQLTTPKTFGTYFATATDLPNGAPPSVSMVIGGVTWNGGFVGVSALRLSRSGGNLLELQRQRDTTSTCP